MAITKVGVLGCGLMGAGIAQVAAQAGFMTVVREVNQAVLDKGLDRINAILEKDVSKGKLSAADRDASLARLYGTTSFEDLADCDLIIEAIVEQLPAKREVFTALDELCPPSTIFVSNTSSLTIMEMAAVTKRPDRFAGLHFFNPVPVMKLVEIVRALTTSDETIASLHELPVLWVKPRLTPAIPPDLLSIACLYHFCSMPCACLKAALPPVRTSTKA